MIDGINYAVEQGADIINISAGTFYDFDNDTYNAEYDMTWGEVYRLAWEMEKAAVDAALEAGAIIVSGSGNEGENIVDYPASHDGVIDVGAINEDLTIANLSNHTQYVDYAAPGANVRGLNTFYEEQGDITMISQGTSMAVPHIVAAVANLLSFNKNLTVDEVKEILNAWAIDLGVTGRDDYFGNGFVDFSDAQFCVDGMKCDNRYGVFAIGPDDSGEDEEPDVPVPDTDGSDEEPDIPVPDTDGSSSTDKDTSKSEGAATNIPVPNTGASTGESNAEKVAISIGAALLIITIGLLTYVVNRQKSKVKF